MDEIRCAVLVVGGGPGGYTAAVRAGQLGLDTVVAEGTRPGGTCLTVGCIPSKALIHVADTFAEIHRHSAGESPFGIRAAAPTIDLAGTMAWKQAVVDRLGSGVDLLLRGAGVRVLNGWARMLDGKTATIATSDGDVVVRAENVILATGSQPVELAAIPFGGQVWSSSDALSLTSLPASVAVVGAGYIGLELGTALAKLGSRVTVLEATDQILPAFDGELVRPVAERLRELGIELHTSTVADRLDEAASVLHATAADGSTLDVDADVVLVTVGRAPRINDWGLEGLDLARNGPAIRVNDRGATSMAGVYAIGDLTGEPMLAHRAVAQGLIVAEALAGRNRGWDHLCVPAVAFTDPEIVTVGMLPDEARASGIDVLVTKSPFTANGRALSAADEAGFVRIVAAAADHRLLGVHAVGAGVSELAAGFALAVEMGGRLEDLDGTIHAHPTRGEAISEAVAQAFRRGAP
jgi:dihydrolipoamide dehydrogenase